MYILYPYYFSVSDNVYTSLTRKDETFNNNNNNNEDDNNNNNTINAKGNEIQG